MKNRAKKRCLRSCAVVMLAVILACVLASCGQAPLEGLPKTIRFADGVVVDQVNEGGELSFEMQDGEMVALSLLAAEAEVTEQGYPTRTLLATVQPASVLLEDQKRVIWAVRWLDNQTGDEAADVADYIMLTPDAEDSKICTVTCLQPFKGSRIEVECTTVAGGYKAQCEVTYTGSAQSIHFAYDGITVTDNTTLGTADFFALQAGETGVVSCVGENCFGEVSPNFDVSVKAGGGAWFNLSFTVSYGSADDKEYGVGARVKDNVVYFVYPKMEQKPSFDGTWWSEGDAFWQPIMNISVDSNGNISFESLLDIEGLVFEGTNSHYTSFKATYTRTWDTAPYVEVTVKDKISGVSNVFRVRVYSEIGVNLDVPSVEF